MLMIDVAVVFRCRLLVVVAAVVVIVVIVVVCWPIIVGGGDVRHMGGRSMPLNGGGGNISLTL